ncbi:5-oxoprolinase/urea amidolyase family protein [Pseudonocardia sp. GCM10023141]|uniref:5-oxoprolinase subunit B/C family protein n=1 Tax=Pseudonocardia sp. GCM10023141 TaxID=3252653 RepID=UPI00360F935D
MRVLACADVGFLIEVDGLPEVLALAAAVHDADLPGVLDVVPAARTLLVTTSSGADLPFLRRRVHELGESARPVDAAADGTAGGTAVTIEVVYDGPDLDEVGELTGLGADGVVEAHSARPWRVGFGGFAPGFAYLAGGDRRLEVPRRSEPRTAVPPGSVGLAGEFSAVYPRSSPGGWQLIGRTAATLWDETRDPPALLHPGDSVRFVAVPDVERSERSPVGTPEVEPGGVLEIVATGPLALLQDRGRTGLATSGVGRSGAADRAALGLANRLVANPEDAAAIEVVLGGLAVRAHRLLTVALTGAPAPADVDGTPVGHNAVLTLRPGQLLRLGVPPVGLRTCLAVRGGITAAAVLGSRATDVLSGIGPAVLRAGQRLPVGSEPSDFPIVDVAPVRLPTGDTVTLRAVPGPRADWMQDASALTRTVWTASSRSDRVGMRLEGDPLQRRDLGELPSEGMVRGAVQVPPGGEPVVFLADHPVTGGYPVVAVLLDADADVAAQVRPGQQVRFRFVPAP